MTEITQEILQEIAGDLERLLLEKQEGLAYAYQRIPDGIKITIGINLDPTSQGVAVSYALSYPLEPTPEPATKDTIKYKRVINQNQPDMFDQAENG